MKPDERASVLVQSEMDYMTDRMSAMMQQEGNPMGAELQRFGGAIAYYCRNMPWPTFNHVKGPLDAGDVDAVIDFYARRDREPEFQIAPGLVNGQTLIKLAERGFYQSGFHVSMYAELDALHDEWASPESVSTMKMDAEDMQTYAEIHCLGTGLSLSGAGYVADNNRILYERPGWHFLLGSYNGIPSSAGVMFVRDDVASCTFAATLPDMRNRGLHTALLRARISLATQLNGKLIVAQCAYGSASHRNMEKVGMRIGMTRATWSRIPLT